MDNAITITDEARCAQIVTEIKTIQKATMRTLLASSCEIGRLLTEAKDKVGHGSFGAWLEDNFQYSQTTANNLMRLYQNYGDRAQMDLFFDGEDRMAVFGSLTPSQALALLPLPESERVEFVETHDMESTSVRDIEAEIKARREAEERAEALEKELTEAKNALEGKDDERDAALEDLEETHRAAFAEKQREWDDRLAELQEALDNAKESADEKKLAEEKKQIKQKAEEAAKKRFEKEKAEIEAKLTEEQKKTGELEKQIEEAAERARREAESEYMGKMLALEQRAKEAEAKAKAGNENLQKFSVHFGLFQQEYRTLVSIATSIGYSDAETAAKLKAGLSAILKGMTEEVGE